MLSAPTAARLALRSRIPSTSARRNLHLTAQRSTSHPAHTSSANGQSVGQDVADTQTKNNAWPAFVAAGVAIVTYIGYSQVSAGKESRQEKAAAPQDEQKKQYVRPGLRLLFDSVYVVAGLGAGRSIEV
ncbi:hypothetical protein JCM5296_000089 [Sporobolomyces johnsonii]